jgi:hypothetical protein
LQKAYARQLIKDLKETILKDPNYNPEKHASLTTVIAGV